MKVHSLAEQSWVMCHYTMLYKYGKRKHDCLGHFFNRTIIPLMRGGYEMTIAKSIISYPTPFVEHILVNYNYRTLYETSFIVCLVFLHSIHL